VAYLALQTIPACILQVKPPLKMAFCDVEDSGNLSFLRPINDLSFGTRKAYDPSAAF